MSIIHRNILPGLLMPPMVAVMGRQTLYFLDPYRKNFAYQS